MLSRGRAQGRDPGSQRLVRTRRRWRAGLDQGQFPALPRQRHDQCSRFDHELKRLAPGSQCRRIVVQMLQHNRMNDGRIDNGKRLHDQRIDSLPDMVLFALRRRQQFFANGAVGSSFWTSECEGP